MLTEIEQQFFLIQYLHPFWGALIGGLLLGYGLLALYRHRASLGGVGILAIYIQDRFGVQAGLVQLAFDLCRSEEHTSELQSLMRISYAVFRLQTKINNIKQ